MSKILIIEDDSEIAMLERDYLEIEGFETTVIADGEAAAEEALRGGYDLLLLDLMLPGCNGYDICRRVRDRIDVPILMSPPAPTRWIRSGGWDWAPTTISPSPSIRLSWWPG